MQHANFKYREKVYQLLIKKVLKKPVQVESTLAMVEQTTWKAQYLDTNKYTSAKNCFLHCTCPYK